MNMSDSTKNTRYFLRFLFAGLVLAVVAMVVIRPWVRSPKESPAIPRTTSPSPVVASGDFSTSGMAQNIGPEVQQLLIGLGALPQSEAATDRVIAMISASLPEDASALESLMRSLGGDFAATDHEFTESRRWWRSVTRARRPNFAAEMSDSQWEQWVNQAGKSDLVWLPDDTRASVREIDRAELAVAKFDTLDQASGASIDATIREIAKERGFSDPERARIIGFQGLLRYRPPDEGKPQPSPIVVLYVSGLTTDDRDFVAAYIFGFREPTGWFPYFVRSLSQHRETTPPERRIPFVPAF